MFNFGIKDFIDIFCVALMLYYIYRLMKESRSLNVFIGILIFIIMWLFVSQVLEMRLLGSIMDKLVSVGVIAIIILFQEEIRKFLYNLGTHHKVKSIVRLFSSGDKKDKVDMESIMPIVMACMNMSKGKVGALIVIERLTPLDDIREPQFRHSQGAGSAPSRRYGHIAGQRRDSGSRVGGDGTHIRSAARTVPPQAFGRAARKHTDA